MKTLPQELILSGHKKGEEFRKAKLLREGRRVLDENWTENSTIAELLLDLQSHFKAIVHAREMEHSREFNKTPVYETILATLLDETEKDKDAAKILKQSYQEALDLYDIVKEIVSEKENYKMLMSFLFDSAKTCQDFISKCFWNSEEVNCGFIFKMLPTDDGICCVFNYDHHILRSEVPLQNFLEENVFNVSQEHENVTLDRLVPLPGYHMGLKVVLDAHSYLNYPRTDAYGFHGFKAAVTDSHDVISVADFGFLLQTGHVNFVALSATAIDAEEGIRETLEVEQRKCLFSDEKDLSLYTQ
jgi:hypothetical protein